MGDECSVADDGNHEEHDQRQQTNTGFQCGIVLGKLEVQGHKIYWDEIQNRGTRFSKKQENELFVFCELDWERAELWRGPDAPDLLKPEDYE